MQDHTTNSPIDRYSHSFRRMSLEARFWANIIKFNDGECWGWRASFFKCGYGQISVNGKPQYAHRVSYELHFGTIPDGLHCLHHCDNKVCCNPDHLFLGTNKDNMEDMRQKNRGVNPPRFEGSGHHQAKLNEEQVREIRERVDRGEKRLQLAKHFNVTRVTIDFIVNRKTWQHIP